jgi:hypothetical protein
VQAEGGRDRDGSFQKYGVTRDQRALLLEQKLATRLGEVRKSRHREEGLSISLSEMVKLYNGRSVMHLIRRLKIEEVCMMES